MIFVVNGKKKSEIEYPIAYWLWGGHFFSATPPLVGGLNKIKWVLKLHAFLLFRTKMEVPKCIKWTAFNFTYKDSENTWTIVNLL